METAQGFPDALECLLKAQKEHIQLLGGKLDVMYYTFRRYSEARGSHVQLPWASEDPTVYRSVKRFFCAATSGVCPLQLMEELSIT